ncbi:MAG: DNA primase [Suipraeoptans sp.]
MYYPEEIIEEVRSRNDIVDVISGYVKLQKKGSTYFGLCPFHNEKTPSFSVSPGNQMYYCFGCGVGGTVYTFIMEYENYSFPEAVQVLADRVGIELPEGSRSDEEKKRDNKKLTLLEINKEAAKFFYANIKEEKSSLAYTYLKNRGLSDDIIKQFGLGYAPKGGRELYQYLRGRGYNDEILMESGLFSSDEKNGAFCKFWNRVMFPIMDANSRVIGFGGRVMGQGEPKYLNSPETPIFDKSRNLYGLNIARKSRKPYFLICEGYMDVISLHKAGLTNAVASLGTAFTSGHASLIRRYVDQVYLTYDSDEAGTRAALRALPILKEAGVSAKIIRMEPYKDPDELIAKEGEEGFLRRVEEARNSFLFSLEILERDYDMNSPEGKTKFMNEVANRLTQFDEEIERNNYIEATAKAYNVKFDDLRKLVSKAAIRAGQAKPAKRAERTSNFKRSKEEGVVTAQKALLTWMAGDITLYESIMKYINKEDFTNEIYRLVIDLMEKQYIEGTINPAQIINHFTDEHDHKEVAGLFHTNIGEFDTSGEKEKAIIETIIKVKSNSLEIRTKDLDPTDMKGLQQLMEDKKMLQKMNTIHINTSI